LYAEGDPESAMVISRRDASSPVPDVPQGADVFAAPPDRDNGTHEAAISRGKSAARAPPPTLRVVGELDAHGRHFLIVEANGSVDAPAIPQPEAAPEADDARPEAVRACSMPELLTQRELQVAALVSIGHLNKQIAVVLKISEYTVSTHIRRIFSKLSISRRSTLASMYAVSVSPRAAPAQAAAAPAKRDRGSR
jgi:DNA-binding CsgD family transcriptional regulator